ncbi:cAMP-independent regulatory protein-like protein [Hapsidospora chrysogenum ATCC 11550]|uniref:cAMP-independent regulatory protein-like protein n=1 Tax=Hapsidospora chrysogenum (strain ATCC 11550 / CBS 779.69 / DSM 880 / IAM 14645 / JCM 23072 / IMI 49137) TaxID=857340 RepID=A0A086TG63_HAPC1|nr:cAMP-independent regulatory protein-like protein [Hapsidospora chrysogenum ATCC 11550]
METYYGYVRTPADAIKLFEACRMGLLPRVQRRLSEKERQSIRSGSVFVWDEREAGMRRWTDGKSWSASRVSGSFLTYREMEGKRGGGFGGARRGSGKTSDGSRASDEDHDDGEPEGYRYKADGLMKQSFSITTSTGQHLHLISYYSRPQPGQPDLPQPTNDPALRHIVPVKGMYPESSMGDTNQTPALTRAPMRQPPYNVPPQHHYPPHQQPYPPHHYGQNGYGWPPSPAATPPYSHYPAAPYHPAHQMPPQGGSQGPPAPPHYAQAPQYEHRPSLPLPPPQKTTLSPYQHPSNQYRIPSPPRINNDAPREQTLQVTAQSAGAIADPRVSTTSARNPQGPLPALNAVTAGAPGSSLVADAPPSCGRSTTPPRSSHSDASTANAQPRSTLSSILHATKDYGPKSNAGGSPRAQPLEAGGLSEDNRALRMLDRSAFRQAVA